MTTVVILNIMTNQIGPRENPLELTFYFHSVTKLNINQLTKPSSPIFLLIQTLPDFHPSNLNLFRRGFLWLAIGGGGGVSVSDYRIEWHLLCGCREQLLVLVLSL